MKTWFRFIFLSYFLGILNVLVLSCSPVDDQKEIICEIPNIKADTADLNINKWRAKGEPIPIFNSVNKIHEISELSAEFNAAWSSEGLIIYCHVSDDILYTDTLNPWKSDALEIFLAPFRGSTDIVQLTILPENNPDPVPSIIVTGDYRTGIPLRNTPVKASACSKRIGKSTYYEVFIPLSAFDIVPGINKMLAMQIYVNDADKKNSSLNNQLKWYPTGHSYDNSFAMFNLVFTDRGKPFPKEISNCYIKDNDSINLTIYSNTLNYSKIQVRWEGMDVVSADNVSSYSYNLGFPLGKINPETDTLRVHYNNKLISVHDLFNVPRLYQKISPPGKFERQIRFFEACDRLSFPPENAILFIGSSSIRRWYSLKEYFPDQEIIQRGFGGSNAADALSYINRIVLPYKPSKIIYYEGDNDISSGNSTQKIVADIDSFIKIVNKNLPETEIFIITPKPSYARLHLWSKFVDLIGGIKVLCETYEFVSYIDIGSSMYDDKGILRKDIFAGDNLHLNEKGYEIWGKVIRDKIIREQ